MNTKAFSKSVLFIAALGVASLPVTAGIFSRSNARVIVDSWAHPEFTAARESENGPRDMFYHLMEGRHFGGYIRDNSLTRVPFMDIVNTLATDFRDARFFPAPNKDEGDMLIVIHWGVTGVEEDLTELMGTTDLGGGEEDSEDINAGEDARFAESIRQSGNRMVESGDAFNAQLTGISKALNKKNLTVSEEYELRSLLRDERYFIILMAFDWQKIRTEKKFEKIWSTRFSLDSIGTNFVDAFPALSRAAAPYLASNLDNIAKNKTHLGGGDVKTGELKVVEEVSNEAVKQEKKK